MENPARSKAISDVIGRAQLLVEGTTPAEADFHTRPTNADKDARAMASYDKLQTASNALATYFTLGHRGRVGRISTRGSRRWRARTAVRRPPGSSRSRPTVGPWPGTRPPRSWNQPETGFLHLDRRLVSALTSSAGGGLTWLGDDTVGSGRDIMHFDMRGLGPIRRIVKTIEGQTISLGNG